MWVRRLPKKSSRRCFSMYPIAARVLPMPVKQRGAPSPGNPRMAPHAPNTNAQAAGPSTGPTAAFAGNAGSQGPLADLRKQALPVERALALDPELQLRPPPSVQASEPRN